MITEVRIKVAMWRRALNNRVYWDKYRIATDSFIAKAKLEAQAAHTVARKERWRKETDARLRSARRAVLFSADKSLEAVPVEPCPECGTPREQRPGNPEPTHLGNTKCRLMIRCVSLPPSIWVPRCTERVYIGGVNRQCPRRAVIDGRCVMCTVRVRQATQQKETG